MCTHEGSGTERSEDELKKALPQSHIKKGLAIKGTLARSSDKKILERIKG